MIRFGTTLLFALTLFSCTRTEVLHRPILRDVRTAPGALMPSATSSSANRAVNVTLTLEKKEILHQEFLWGADLQYSTIYDADGELYTQSLAIGHIPAHFRVAGDELQLVSSTEYRYGSDVNHPEELISRYRILSETETTLTVSGADSSAMLEKITRMIDRSVTPKTRDQWIRSFEYVRDGNYLLQQTSLRLSDGNILEFMESLFPRATLKPSDRFESFEMDPADLIGGSEGPVARFRFLTGDTVYKGQEAISYAQHFDLPAGGTIDWYVTPNVPDEYIDLVRQGVEGWNRYFASFKGIERRAIRFMGKLPEGVRLGDPRFNVINWDSRRIGTTAYESQAVDPMTGKQSHSLIFLPAAWLRIGTDYWKKGVASDPTEGANARRRGTRIACAREMREAAALLASGRVSEAEVETFARQLLRQTLFHEVGHALGLAHNFKGSLSFDRAKTDSMFSTSIMDYNDFELERKAFNSLNGDSGPLLEYDRQALSALYNAGKDIADSDAKVPACNDAEADNEEGGVDPLCIRYDLEKDPTTSVETAFKRITETKLDRDLTLSQALANAVILAAPDRTISEIRDEEAFLKAATTIGNSLKGTMSFYVVAGYGSLSRTVRTNLKSLLVLAEDVLPEEYDVLAMRDRAFSGVQRAVTFTSLNAGTQKAVEDAYADALSRLNQSPYLKGLSGAEAERARQTALKKIQKTAASFLTDEKMGLPKMRAAVLGSLKRHEAVPYFFGKAGDAVIDYEAAIIGILADAIPVTSERTASERTAATQSLATFAGRHLGDKAISSVREKLKLEQLAATDNETRELLEELLAILK